MWLSVVRLADPLTTPDDFSFVNYIKKAPGRLKLYVKSPLEGTRGVPSLCAACSTWLLNRQKQKINPFFLSDARTGEGGVTQQ